MVACWDEQRSDRGSRCNPSPCTKRVAPWNTIDYEYLLSGEMNLFMEDEGMAMRGALGRSTFRSATCGGPACPR